MQVKVRFWIYCMSYCFRHWILAKLGCCLELWPYWSIAFKCGNVEHYFDMQPCWGTAVNCSHVVTLLWTVVMLEHCLELWPWWSIALKCDHAGALHWIATMLEHFLELQLYWSIVLNCDEVGALPWIAAMLEKCFKLWPCWSTSMTGLIEWIKFSIYFRSGTYFIGLLPNQVIGMNLIIPFIFQVLPIVAKVCSQIFSIMDNYANNNAGTPVSFLKTSFKKHILLKSTYLPLTLYFLVSINLVCLFSTSSWWHSKH